MNVAQAAGGLAQRAPIPNAPTARESQTQGQFTRLASGTKYLHDRLAVLRDRISPLLRNEPTGPAQGEQRAQLVPHAEQLASFADAVDEANAVIEDILARLEL